METTYTPTVYHISAKEGSPSTFWKGESGRYYRTLADAKEDNSSKSVNPENYEIEVSFFVKYKKYILGALVAAVVTAAMFYFIPKVVAKYKK